MSDDEAVGIDAVGVVHTERAKEQEQQEDEEFLKLLEMRRNKKKEKKKQKKDKEDETVKETEAEMPIEGGGVPSEIAVVEPSNYFAQEDNRDYPYTVLLDRIFDQLREFNPSLMEKSKHKLPPPKLGFVGSKRTLWGNFKETCDLLGRKQEHVVQFFLAEMNTTGNLDGSHNLLLRGRWRNKQVESLLRKYIKEYVQCSSCKSMETTMTKDNATRLFELTCRVCGAVRRVQSIQAGFRATTRDDRRAAKNAKR